MLAVIVYAYGETNSYSIEYQDLVGVFTNKRAMLKALKEDGFSRAQIAEYNWCAPVFPSSIQIDYIEKRGDKSAYSFEVINLNEKL